ncbi:serine/threonine-protein phosphatase 4 regulatory subunit 2 isoform X2 [Episyrphus balteatus]|uniref:serine/threonine-protein phosphatase 4 regulatory subunit 2 isoform X2 n=1 Tax=Episyrphus balteatus TaxID=286459 RepID=UPI0024866A7B|nr:serine/threonine-protein phosphatase 4 regulatory subunit 2 isoform X2 [Episyrphus balteatus]
MLNMENAEEVMQILERFTRLKQKEIPKELDDYMHYVAKTGDTVFKWSSLKYLFREKLLNVIKNFHDTSPRVDDLPQYPNVDPFNYESMKSSLLERLELFNAAPFTVQRLCELLTEPRKQYSRIDKFMRALEKNILVSTIEPGRKQTESENGDSLDSVVNGDVSLDVNVDIEMENETIFNAADAPSNATPSETTPAAQPSSNLIHKADDDILPNPKKAKLDLDETNDAETEAATKSIATIKPEPTIPSVEVSMAEEKTDTSEKKQDEEPVSEEKPAPVENVVVEVIKKDNKEPEPEKMEEDLPDSATNDETKNDVKSELKESEKKPEEKEVASPISAAPIAKVAEEESKQPKAAEETVDSITDVQVKNAEKETIADKEEKKEDCSQEQIIEKTKEVSEKEKPIDEEVQNGDVKPSELKTETNITTTVDATNNKQSEMAVDETAPSASEEKVEDIIKDKKEETTTAANVTVAVVEKVVEAEVVPTPDTKETTKDEETKVADEPMVVSEEKPAPAEEKKAPTVDSSTESVKEPQTATQEKTESPQIEAVAKPDEDVKSAEVKEKETEKPTAVVDSPAVDTPKAEATAADAPAVEKKEPEAPSVETTSADPPTPAAVVKEAPVEVAVEKADVEKAEVEKAAVKEPAVEKPAAVTPTVDESPAIVPPTNDSPATEAAPTEKKPEVAAAPTTEITPAVTASTVISAVEEAPAITADQPMEENPESIAEAEPVVPAIVVEAAATVEEVVMGDSAAMATDAIEPAKDEPAGMEVDDTSQEAMDQ